MFEETAVNSLFPLAPRYRLDDEMPWLEGIDPSRHYWIRVNGEEESIATIPGLNVSSHEAFREAILEWRSLQPGREMTFERAAGELTIHCISENCFAIASSINGAAVWHLFDRETLESFLMTAHPDWKCAPKDVELGRKMLARSLQLSIAS